MDEYNIFTLLSILITYLNISNLNKILKNKDIFDIFKVICMYVCKEICIESLGVYFRTTELEQKIE